MERIVPALAAALFLLAVAGCGQSGPLYLPGDPSQIQSPSTASPNAEEDRQEKEEDREIPQDQESANDRPRSD